MQPLNNRETERYSCGDGNRLELFLALRVGEDDLIDILLQVYSSRKDYLPVGLQVFLLDEIEEVFSKYII
ncbi:hypothetical protein D5R40_27795 [Okeania hirsuta]|uniref:Uncharacterized protein n=1 Tax=Okeania hirsuta TaxID=1458930 RepID=A0A3N6R6N2_9CYAN|nr:hypothetical protein D5R40_27795 [Okeania hirsuta]